MAFVAPEHFEAFVDEYGDVSLDTDKRGVTNNYIITAVVVRSAKVDDVRVGLEAVRLKHFQSGEMKSSTIGKNLERRKRVLDDLRAVRDWRHYSLVVDKRDLRRDGGLIYKKPFILFLGGKLYERLYAYYKNIRVIADQRGSPEFMGQFQRYVDARFVRTLFTQAEFGLRDSKADVLLQTADVIAGSLARVFDEKKTSDEGQVLLKTLVGVSVGIDTWPPRLIVKGPDEFLPAPSEDRFVREQALASAIRFIDSHKEPAELEERCQLEVVRFLYFHHEHVDRKSYVSTQRLIQLCGDATGESIKETFFRSRVIAKIRDCEVLLASSAKGYKLPAGMRDMRDFVKHGQNIIEPMLLRLDKARRHLLVASNGDVDLLAGENYAKLRELIDTFATKAPKNITQAIT